MVASGLHRTVLALGVEKANHEDRQRTFAAYKAGFDPDEMPELAPGSGTDRTPLVDRQAQLARDLMERHGLDREALAAIAARSLANAAKNPVAHRRFGATVDDVLAARMVVDPITTLMSSPVSDGAAAAVVTAADEPRPRDVRIAASRLATRPPLSRPDGPSATRTAVSAALRDAGVTPDQVDVAELHDASVAYEVIAWQRPACARRAMSGPGRRAATPRSAGRSRSTRRRARRAGPRPRGQRHRPGARARAAAAR